MGYSPMIAPKPRMDDLASSLIWIGVFIRLTHEHAKAQNDIAGDPDDVLASRLGVDVAPTEGMKKGAAGGEGVIIGYLGVGG